MYYLRPHIDHKCILFFIRKLASMYIIQCLENSICISHRISLPHQYSISHFAFSSLLITFDNFNCFFPSSDILFSIYHTLVIVRGGSTVNSSAMYRSSWPLTDSAGFATSCQNNLFYIGYLKCIIFQFNYYFHVLVFNI